MNTNQTSGNNALQPKIDTSYEKYKKLKKERKEHFKRLNDKKLNKKLKMLRKTVLVFGIGVILLSRYAYICNLRHDVSSVQTQISKANKENDNLSIQLLKYNNLAYIENTASNNLNMIKSNYKTAVYCNLSKNDSSKNKNTNDNKTNKIIKNLMSKLF